MSGERARATRGRRLRRGSRGAPPLPRRRTDRVEDLVAWLLTSLGLLTILASVLVGRAARHAVLGQAAGHVVADPVERSAEAWAFGISAGLTVVALSWALLTLAWSAVCRLTAARNTAGWAREWARVEPRWRRSMH